MVRFCKQHAMKNETSTPISVAKLVYELLNNLSRTNGITSSKLMTFDVMQTVFHIQTGILIAMLLLSLSEYPTISKILQSQESSLAE